MMKIYKIMFFSAMIMGTIIAISSTSWLGMWMGLEINLLSIIPLMASKKNVMSNESAMKYFVTQALASTIFLFAIITMMFMMNEMILIKNFAKMILDTALFTKMGAAPFHFWFPEIIEGLQWFNCFIMLTWQKIAPMVILMYETPSMIFISIVIISSMIVSGFMGMNQTSLRKILTFSSINHIAWMLSAMMFLEKIWVIYFVIYTIISMNLIYMFYTMDSFTIKQMLSSMNNNQFNKILFSMNFFSLGGLPPFLGFMPKWLTIQTLIENNMMILTFIMTIATLLTLYFYMRIAFPAMLLSTSENNWTLLINNKNSKSMNLLTFNIVTIMGLIVCTLYLNYI